jgi:hypothetical protein
MAVTGLFAMKPAHAHRRDFPVTYDWFQASKGEREIETHSAYNAAENSFEQQVEFEYGISDRFMIAPYVNFEREPGGNLRYSGFQIESRYQLGNYKVNRWLPGLYLEFEKPRAEDPEVEGKLILSRYDSHGGEFSLNLEVERPLSSGADTGKTFSLGYARDLAKRSRLEWRGGLELVRNIDDGRVDLGPVLGFSPFSSKQGKFYILGGFGFPVNKRDINNGEARLLAEYEF